MILTGNSCSKSYSLEGATFSFKASGSLKDSVGNCQNIIINGRYLKDSLLTDSNYIRVSVNITATGKYTIYTDTSNGIWFRDTGTVMNTGLHIFKLKGYGQPISFSTSSFIIHFDNSICTFIIPPNQAVFNFISNSGNCPVISVFGGYSVGASLSIADTVTFPINVTIPGIFSIKTVTINGLTFSSQGTFYEKGTYNMTLVGKGIPAAPGTSFFPLTIANTTCSFSITSVYDTTMFWQFSVGRQIYSGYFKDSIPKITPYSNSVYPNNKIFSLQMDGGDRDTSYYSYLTLVISRINNSIVTGQYHPGPLGGTDFTGTMFYNQRNNALIFASDNSLTSFTVNLLTYDGITGLVQGSFSGPVVMNPAILGNASSGQIVNITNGQFKIYLSH